jgi:hypothetical protein
MSKRRFPMSINVLNDKGRKNEQKGMFYPFMRILEEFMAETKKNSTSISFQNKPSIDLERRGK